MLQAFGLARLGRDAEVRYTAKGETVASLSLAFDLRVKGEKVTQWVDGALWGKQAEALAPYLTKGKQIAVQVDDLRIEEFKGKDGPRVKLVGNVSKIDLAGGGEKAQAQEPRKAPQAKKPPASAGFDDMDDDVPF